MVTYFPCRLRFDFQGKIDRLLEIVFLLFVNDEKLCICIQGVVLGDDAAIKHYLQDLSISNDFTERYYPRHANRLTVSGIQKQFFSSVFEHFSPNDHPRHKLAL